MASTAQNSASVDSTIRPAAWKLLLAFGIIYFVWGSTFLAIRIGVREVPPFLLAAIRFIVAGIVLFAWMRAKGHSSAHAAGMGIGGRGGRTDFRSRLWACLLG